MLHLVTIKPILIGGVAARLSPVRGVVYAVSGLGHVFVADGWLGHLRRKLVGAWYRFVLGAQNMRIIFQNPDDRREIESLVPLDPAQVVMIPGSGVDLGLYRPAPVPTGVPVVLMASRLLATKGTREYVAAAQLLRAQGVRAKFLLVGDPDPDNPASIPAVELERWAEAGEVTLLGHQAEMASLMSCAHVVVLPSIGKDCQVLIEAAACGRAVVTTDVQAVGKLSLRCDRCVGAAEKRRPGPAAIRAYCPTLRLVRLWEGKGAGGLSRCLMSPSLCEPIWIFIRLSGEETDVAIDWGQRFYRRRGFALRVTPGLVRSPGIPKAFGLCCGSW